MNLGGLLVRSRPRFWLYLAGPALVGLAYGAESVGDLTSPAAIALVAYFLIPANLFLYGVNDVFDAEADAENPRKAGRERRYRGDDPTPVAAAVGAGLGLVLLVALPPAGRPWVAGFLLLGAAYSAPPLRLKGRPPLDSVSNGLYVLPGGAAYATLAGAAPPALALLGGWLWTMGMHTFSAVPDVAPDRRAGVRTTATALGRRGALGYCLVCWLLAAAAFGALDWRAGGLLLGYPVAILAVEGLSIPVERAYWWFPAANAVVGALLTLGGLRGIVHVHG
jgi:4-hydroxybenzoate polyprenyltransferase